VTAPTTPNAELAYRVLDHIDAHPEQWNQGRWIGKTECGTVGCFAGWAVVLSGAEPVIDYGDETGEYGASAELDGKADLISDMAERLLRANRWFDEGGEDEQDLFSEWNTREDLGRLVAEIFGPRPERVAVSDPPGLIEGDTAAEQYDNAAARYAADEADWTPPRPGGTS
jgi:hypothetical protein